MHFSEPEQRRHCMLNTEGMAMLKEVKRDVGKTVILIKGSPGLPGFQKRKY